MTFVLKELILILLFSLHIFVYYLIGNILIYLIPEMPNVIWFSLFFGWAYKMFSNDYDEIVSKTVNIIIKEKN